MPNWQDSENDQSRLEWWEVIFTEQLNNISSKIDNLNNNKDDLKKLLTDEFIDNLDNFLKNDETLRTQLQNKLISALNSYADKNDEVYGSLSKLAKKIWLENTNWTWSVKSQENANNVLQMPTLNFEWNLDWISKVENGNEQVGDDGLYDELTRNPIEWNNIDDNKNLNKTINTINDEINSLNRLLLDDKLSNDQNLSNLKDILQNIKDVIYNTTPENVKKLQEFF